MGTDKKNVLAPAADADDNNFHVPNVSSFSQQAFLRWALLSLFYLNHEEKEAFCDNLSKVTLWSAVQLASEAGSV